MFARFYVRAQVLTAATLTIYFFPGATEWLYVWVLVVCQISLFTLLALAHSMYLYSVAPTVSLFAWSVLVSLGAEIWGVHAAGPFFSGYTYAAYMGPQVAGVPVIIPLTWYGLCYQVLLATEGLAGCLARAGLPLLAQFALRALVCGYVLFAVDLLIEPVGTGLGAWQWHDPGCYYTSPLGNFVGWFCVGMVIFTGHFLAVGPARPDPASSPGEADAGPSRPRALTPEDSKEVERLGMLTALVIQAFTLAMTLWLGGYLAVLLYLLALTWVGAQWYHHVFSVPGASEGPAAKVPAA